MKKVIKGNANVLTKTDIRKVEVLVSDAMDDLQGTLLIALNVLIAKSFEADKIEAAMKLAATLIAVNDD